MGDHIHNHFQNVTIGGNYVGGNQIHRGTDSSIHSAQQENSTDEPTIFLSYCRNNKEEADRLEQELTVLGMLVKRDIRDIGPWKSIRAFMDTIREQDIAVLLVSDAYLKSRNCMYEVLEIMKEISYRERIFPAVLEPSIYQPAGKAAYISYWEEEYRKLDERVRSIQNEENKAELAQDLRHIRRIGESMGEFLATVADMNNPDLADTVERIESFLKERRLA
ncbi:toll/interleukin-1 receptor domain-containing protein [Akkermansia muciniphila]|uniref:toll/interleukin-1 receptor domain-containing protein n=1 Tax=Akkermansia muciniphila TaxID=239935 RepID=UPI001BFFACBF|nr:toll/interleukin-1 receptor domain-containing protein [Akkermansia muciniphila]MBT8778904.1 toll/interleukin-1 receptor domain-containing protein [Akkermansia muciniphila]